MSKEFVFNQLRPIKYTDKIIDFYKGKTSDPNCGLMSQDEYDKALASYKSSRTSLPILYQPILVQAGVKAKALFAFTGQRSTNEPSPQWPQNEIWTNRSKLELGRICHIPDARKMVNDSEANLISIGPRSYVIGTESDSAIFCINASSSGINKHAILEGKRLSLSNCQEIKNIVGLFNPEISTFVLDDGTTPGPELVAAPNMVIQAWGYLYRNNTILSYGEIREAVADGTANSLEFKEIQTPIIGTGFSKRQLEEAINTKLSNTNIKNRKGGRKNVGETAWYNLSNTLSRTNPSERTPFGFYSLQCKMPPCKFFSDDGTQPLIRFVVNVFVGEDYRETGWDVRRKLSKTPSKKRSPKSTGNPKPRPIKTKPVKVPPKAEVQEYNLDADLDQLEDELEMEMEQDTIWMDDENDEEVFIPESYEEGNED